MKRTLAWLLVLAAWTLACGFLSDLVRFKQEVETYATQLPQALEGERPAEGVEATPGAGGPAEEATAPSPGEGAFSLQGRLTEADRLRTGHERFLHTLTVGDQTFTLMKWEHLFDRDNQAEAWVLGFLQEPEQRVTYREGAFWIQQGQQWIRVDSPSEEVEPAVFQDWEDLVGMAQWQQVGEETVAGVTATHYRAQGVSIPPTWASNPTEIPGLPALAGLPTVTGTTAEVWVSPEGYLVKSRLRWDLSLPLQEGGTVAGREEWLWEMVSINQPVDIPAPAQEEAALTPPIPLPEDAHLVVQTNQPPTWSYTVPSWDMETAVAYLRAQFEAQGFRIVNAQEQPGLAFFMVQDAEGRQWMFNLAPSSGGTGVDVIIQAMQ